MSSIGRRRLQLFWVFFKIGLFTFGGGYAMIPLIEREAVDNKKWITTEDILDILAIAESTPGPLAINSATFVGYKVGGFLGACMATLGVALPSLIIIVAISAALTSFNDNRFVASAFRGIRAGVVLLMINAIAKLGKAVRRGIIPYAMMGLAFVLAAFTPINIILILLSAAVLGILIQLAAAKGWIKGL